MGKSPPACTRGPDGTVTLQNGQETLDMWVQSVVPPSWGLLRRCGRHNKGISPHNSTHCSPRCCHVCVGGSLFLVERADGASTLCKIPLVPQIHAEPQNHGKAEAERDHRQAPVQPPAHSKVSYESRSGGSRLYPAAS